MRTPILFCLILATLMTTPAWAAPSRRPARAHRATEAEIQQAVGDEARLLAQADDFLGSFDRTLDSWARTPKLASARSDTRDLIKSDLVLGNLVDYGHALANADGSAQSKQQLRQLESQLASLDQQLASLTAFNVQFGKLWDALASSIGDSASDSAAIALTQGEDLTHRLQDSQLTLEKLVHPEV